MKQLTIFKPTIKESINADLRKRLKKGRQTKTQDHLSMDLWTQEKEVEREMTLFFLDIRNFTPFVEKHGAVDVIYIVRKLFSAFQNIIRVNHGQIIETSGDGFYAAFGYEENISEAVNGAVRSGYAILETLESLNESCFRKKLSHYIEVGIGVHAGKVATGNIFLGGQDHKIVMGYPVNIAARLEAATKTLNNSFIVSSKVFDMLDHQPVEQPSAEIQLKGVEGPCKIHMLGKPYLEN